MIVIDASVATKFINTQEKDSDSAEKIFIAHLKGTNKIIVPPLLFLEVANALVTKTSIPAKLIQEGVQFLSNAGFRTHTVTKTNLLETSLLAQKHHTTVYDMLYAVVAKENRCHLITADEQFLKKTRFSFVYLLHSL